MAYIYNESQQSTTRIRIDAEDFLKDAHKLTDSEFPKAFASSLTMVGMGIQNAVRIQTREVFELHTDWIPRNIQLFPNTKGQLRKMETDLRKKGECFATITNSRNIKDWMTIHEYGGVKYPTAHSGSRDTGKKIAIPINSENRQFKTSTGRTAARYKPTNLLAGYDPSKRGKKKGSGGGQTRPAFILRKNSRQSFIVRRMPGKTRKLEWLYLFANMANIKPEWHFEDTGWWWAQLDGNKTMEKGLNAFCRQYSR